MTTIHSLEYQVEELHGDEWELVPEHCNFGMDDLTATSVAEYANDNAAGELFDFRRGCTNPSIEMKIRLRSGGPHIAFNVYAEPSISYYARARDGEGFS